MNETISTDNYRELETSLGCTFNNPSQLMLALTHKSFANENGEPRGDNERLEFLGDSVLGLILSTDLMSRYPVDPEGGLSKKRASLVNEDVLAKLAIELGLERHLRMGKGEIKSGGLLKPRILASALEAVFGAIFLDAGYIGASAAVTKLFATRLEELSRSGVDFHQDFKTRLQEFVQERWRATPVYKVESETGPDHDKKFDVSVQVAGEAMGMGSGKSKKAAEQDAARLALEKLEANS